MELDKKKKRYNKEFKDSAVKLVQTGKKSAAQVARELGLPEWQVQNWVREFKKRESATGGDGNLLEENKRLRKELAQAKEEAEILKKAAAYFARHQQ